MTSKLTLEKVTYQMQKIEDIIHYRIEILYTMIFLYEVTYEMINLDLLLKIINKC